MKKVIAVVVLGLALTACGNGGSGNVDGSTKYVEVERPDGKTVGCVIYDNSSEGFGGIDCLDDK